MASLVLSRLAPWRVAPTPASLAAGWRGCRRSLSDSVRISKNQILAVRKATGVGLDKCRKALVEKNGDVDEATAWVLEQAKAQGWTALEKRGDRTTTQGLLGLLAERFEGRSLAALVELNCETDFVARTDDFHALLFNITRALMHHGQNRLSGMQSQQLQVYVLESMHLQNLDGGNSRSCGEDLAEAVGRIGECLILRRGVVLAAPSLASYVHSSGNTRHSAPGGTLFQAGQFCALAELQQLNGSSSELETENLGTHLCQHIVGFSVDSSHSLALPEPQQRPFNSKSMQESNACLLEMPFLLDESKTVHEVLTNAGVEVGAFYRFALGDSTEV